MQHASALTSAYAHHVLHCMMPDMFALVLHILITRQRGKLNFVIYECMIFVASFGCVSQSYSHYMYGFSNAPKNVGRCVICSGRPKGKEINKTGAHPCRLRCHHTCVIIIYDAITLKRQTPAYGLSLFVPVPASARRLHHEVALQSAEQHCLLTGLQV